MLSGPHPGGSSRRGLIRGSAGLAVAGLAAGASSACAAAPGPPDGTPTEHNRALVREHFERAARDGTLSSTGNFYDILAEDVEWTIEGATSRTYTSREEFLVDGANPVLLRLATPTHPTVRGLHADGDTVVVRWDGTATALDGVPYANRFCWIFTLRDDRATRVSAFLDTAPIDELIARVPLP
jgi:uncharacterized protein